MRSALLALALVALAGCTSGGGSPNAAGNPSAAAVGVWREFVACARNNGQANWPDPIVDSNTGKATFPAVAGFEEKLGYEAVREKCASILDKLPPQANPLANPPITPEKLQVLREFAQCLRENGIKDQPDPLPDGTLPDPTPPPGGWPTVWPTEAVQARSNAFAVCDPIYEPRLRG